LDRDWSKKCSRRHEARPNEAEQGRLRPAIEDSTRHTSHDVTRVLTPSFLGSGPPRRIRAYSRGLRSATDPRHRLAQGSRPSIPQRTCALPAAQPVPRSAYRRVFVSALAVRQRSLYPCRRGRLKVCGTRSHIARRDFGELGCVFEGYPDAQHHCTTSVAHPSTRLRSE
jgi:hypothetical protein